MNTTDRTTNPLGQRHIERRTYNGYLAFLPPVDTVAETAPFSASIAAEDCAHYRQFHTRDFCWFEFKHTLPDAPYGFHIKTAGRYLWLFLQFLGGGQISVKPVLYTEEGLLYCYHAPGQSKELSLRPGKNWFFLLGIAQNLWGELAREFPLLQEKGNLTEPRAETAPALIGKMSLQAKLMAALDSLSRMEFRPFSLSFRLAAWNLRLFNLVFQDLKSVDKAAEGESARIALYYKAVQYIRENYREEWINVEAVAKAMNVSVRTLTRSFENRPFRVSEHIQELRLLLARDILTDSEESIASISFDCHFVSEKHFSRLFKSRFGQGPNDYRIAMQGDTPFKHRRKRC